MNSTENSGRPPQTEVKNNEVEKNNNASSELENKLHPLKEKWFVFYIPAVKESQDYDDACIELDYVNSIEETFAVINTFPHPTLLPSDDNVVFSRNKVEPRFESFPGGHRIMIFNKTKIQCNESLARVLAAVLGEELLSVCNGEPVADLVRFAHKPYGVYNESVRIEVWMRESSHVDAVTDYFKDLLKTSPGVTVASKAL